MVPLRWFHQDRPFIADTDPHTQNAPSFAKIERYCIRGFCLKFEKQSPEGRAVKRESREGSLAKNLPGGVTTEHLISYSDHSFAPPC